MKSRTSSAGRNANHQNHQHLIRWFCSLFLTALAVLLVLPATPASAHAGLVSTTPGDGAVLATAPRTIELVFGEPVALVPDGFQLYDGSGGHRTLQVEQLDETVTAALPPNLTDGSYKLTWRVVSGDSHPASGVLSFTVGQASASGRVLVKDDAGPVDVLYGVLNAVGYLALFCLAGLTVFDLFVARTTAACRRLSRVAALFATSAYVLLVPLAAVRERGSGLGGLVDPAVVASGWHGGAAVTLVLALSGMVLMLLGPRIPGRGGFWARTVGAVIALASVLPVGHTRTFGPAWLVMGSDLVHAATAAVWLGGLLGLILYLTRARRRKGDPADAAVVLGRFSTLAGGLVVLLGISGTILAVVMVGSVATLIGSSYGRLLMAKLAIVAVIGGLAAWNRFGLVPRLTRAGRTGKDWNRLALAVRLEAVGVVLVIGLTSPLTLQNPRETEAPAPAGIELLADLGTGHLTGRFGPGKTGVNVITFELTDTGGAPIVPLSTPQVTVAEPNLSLGPLTAKVEPGEIPGSYRAVVVLPNAGQWKISVAVRINALEQPAAVADVVVIG